MKKYALYMLSLLLISCVQSPKSAIELAQESFKLSERAFSSFPEEIPRTIKTFRFKEPSISEKSVLNLQKRHGFEPYREEVKESPSHFWVQDGDWYFEVSKFSGQRLVANLAKYRKQPQDKRWSLNDEKLKAIAKEYIAKWADVNMEEVVKEPHIRYTTSSVGNTEDTTRMEEAITEADVIFTRELNKIPVIGPGSKLVITISADGSVSGFYKIWREIDYDAKTPEVKTINSIKAIEDLIKKTVKFRQLEKVSYIQLDIAAFGYWASPRHWQQKTLLPAHTFVYSLRNEKGLGVSKAREELIQAYEGPEIDSLGGIDALKKARKPIEPNKREDVKEREKLERESQSLKNR